MAETSRVPRAIKRQLIEQHGNACEICGWKNPVPDLFQRSTISIVQAHHIVPAACGGLATVENLILLCPNHHIIAHEVLGKPAGIWRGPRTREELIATLKRLESNPNQWMIEQQQSVTKILEAIYEYAA